MILEATSVPSPQGPCGQLSQRPGISSHSLTHGPASYQVVLCIYMNDNIASTFTRSYYMAHHIWFQYRRWVFAVCSLPCIHWLSNAESSSRNSIGLFFSTALKHVAVPSAEVPFGWQDSGQWRILQTLHWLTEAQSRTAAYVCIWFAVQFKSKAIRPRSLVKPRGKSHCSKEIWLKGTHRW